MGNSSDQFGAGSAVSQSVQAMAGFGGSGAVDSSNPVLYGADTSSQSLLAIAQRA
jgi:hypothetical protein